MNAELVKETKGEPMRKLSDAGMVLIGLAFVLIFAFGLYLGARVQEGIDSQRTEIVMEVPHVR